MGPQLRTVIYPVTDLAAAKATYGALLGVPPAMDEAYYVGYEADGWHLGLDPNGAAQGMAGPQTFWHVDDLDKTLGVLVDAGATVERPARDVGGGRLVAVVRDADGNTTGLLQPGPQETG